MMSKTPPTHSHEEATRIDWSHPGWIMVSLWAFGFTMMVALLNPLGTLLFGVIGVLRGYSVLDQARIPVDGESREEQQRPEDEADGD